MAVIVDRDTKLVVQGLTGREGSFHALRKWIEGQYSKSGASG